jgi:hypothetical protein
MENKEQLRILFKEFLDSLPSNSRGFAIDGGPIIQLIEQCGYDLRTGLYDGDIFLNKKD